MSNAVAERKGLLGNEKGLTLIELLAVIVILAIIAAIAIPSIGGIITKTKKEAHRSNAQMIVDAARYAVTTEDFPLIDPNGTNNATYTVNQQDSVKEGTTDVPTYSITVPVIDLVTKGYLESMPKDSENSSQTYNTKDSVVKIHKIVSSGKYRYEVKLVKSNDTDVFADEFVLEENIKFAKLN